MDDRLKVEFVDGLNEGGRVNQWPPSAAILLLIGRALLFGPNAELSATGKHCVAGRLHLTVSGFVGDEQGDRLHHGGPDKALHHYPGEHYAVWRHELPQEAAESFSTGGFRENIATIGLTEQSVCVGDIFRCGTALIQVSQARPRLPGRNTEVNRHELEICRGNPLRMSAEHGLSLN